MQRWRFLTARLALRPFHHDEGVWGILPRNPEQHLALELLLDPEIPIVTLNGKAGTGKTLLALAVGLHMMLMENRYTRMIVPAQSSQWVVISATCRAT